MAVVLPALFAAVACAKGAGTSGQEQQSRSTAARGERTEDETSPQRPAAEVEDLALAKAIDRKICRKRGCCVSGIEDAGTDRKGRSLVVATIDAGNGGVASCLVPPAVEPASFGSGALDKEPCPIKPPAETQAAAEEGDSDENDEASQSGQAVEQDPESEECRPYEHHLIVHSHGKIRARQLLSEECNNGYGAAGVGEDTVSVDAEQRTFSHNQSGGSAWRWDKGVTFGLDPLRIVSVDESSFWTLDEEGTSKSAGWNFDTFEGTQMWSAPDCEARRKQAESANPDSGVSGPEPSTAKEFNAVIVPRVELPPAFVQDRWRSIALGNCGAFVDGDKSGFAVYGGKGRAADASLRAVISKDGVLFVEITDDRWTSGGKSWVKEDHIELWLGPSEMLATGCDSTPDATPDADPSRQWGIRISDGQVFPGFGSPAPLAGVDVARSGHTARVRIPIAEWLKGDDDGTWLTVVYSDSDDGLHQKRLIATSEVQRGQVLSLGRVRTVDPGDATCVVKGKALQINRPPFVGGRDQAAADP